MDHEGACNSKILRFIYKNIILLLFFILPVKISRAFLELSVAMLITDVRYTSGKTPKMDLDKFTTLVNKTYNKDILALPNYTLSWFWDKESLASVIHLREGNYTLQEALQDEKLLRGNMNTVSNAILNRLPYLLKVKLSLSDKNSYRVARHLLVSMFNRDVVAV